MATIRKRALPSGKTAWQADYVDGAGKRRHEQFATKKAADSFLVTARGEVSRGIHTADGASITVNEGADLWLAHSRGAGREEATLKRYTATVDLYVRPTLGKLKLSRVTTPIIQEHIDALAPTMSRSSLKKVRGAISSIFSTAVRKGKAAHNPTHEVELPSSARRDGKVEMPTKAELRAISRQLRSDGCLSSARHFSPACAPANYADSCGPTSTCLPARSTCGAGSTFGTTLVLRSRRPARATSPCLHPVR